MEILDHVRELVINEPRGHSDMYGWFVIEPDDQAAKVLTRLPLDELL
jgi:proline racemase